MRLLLLGTTGYHPSERRQTACLMLPEVGVVLDAGTAMFRVRKHLVTATLDIFLTHAHLDHVVGLTYLWNVVRSRDMQHVCVHGDRSKLAAIRRNLFAKTLFPAMPPITWKPMTSPVSLPDGGTIDCFPVAHPGEAVGYRLDWPDRSLAYVTDTTAAPGSAYVERIRGVDVLVHECQFPDGCEDRAQLTGHSCMTPVVQVAAEANVGRLILVHIDPLSDEPDPIGLQAARRIFAAAEIGEDGMEIDF